MLAYKGLVELERALRDQTVLSIYVNGELSDPAKRRRWRVDLRHAFDDIESWLKDSSHAEREGFAACRAMVEERLGAFRGTIRSPGWAGFFTTDGEQYGSALPVPMPTMAVWSTGPCLTPYMRAMKESRPVVIAVVDSSKAQLYRYAGHEAVRVETVRAHATVEPPAHMGRPSRTGFHMGTRGPTGTDQAQRELREATDRMLVEVAEKIVRHAAPDGWIAVGGIPSVAAAALARLPAALAARARHAPSVDVHATKAQIAEAARESASALRNAEDLKRVMDTMASAESDGRGALGSVDVLHALRDGRARELYFTSGYLGNRAADAESAVRQALDTHTFVEHVSGEAAETLDAVGGIAARLRYPAPVATF
jgi:protein required for attachment to host cells